MLRTKNLNLLPILLALLEEESVIGAAQRVHLSQPAVSGALARLRVEFDDQLLVRVGRGMRRTSRAERLLPQVRQSCAEVERLFDFGIFDPTKSTERFVVAAPDHLSFLATRELLPILEIEAPGVGIHFVDPPTDLTSHLNDGTIDLAMAGNFGLWSDVGYKPLIRERFVAAMAADHPLARRDSLTADEVAQYVRLTRTAARLSSTRELAVETGIPVLEFDSQISLERYSEAVLLTIDTDTVVPAPAMLIEHLARLAPIVGVPFTPSDSVEAGLFWALFQNETPEILWLRSLIERCFEADLIAPTIPPSDELSPN